MLVKEAYYLRIILEGGTAMYLGHSGYLVDPEPSFKSLMELKDARTKRTKLLKQGFVFVDRPGDDEDRKIRAIDICTAIIDFNRNEI